MKKLPFLFLLGILSIIVTSSCNSDEKTQYHQYECPMKCEGDKTYNKPGICPVCEMDLEGVEEIKSK